MVINYVGGWGGAYFFKLIKRGVTTEISCINDQSLSYNKHWLHIAFCVLPTPPNQRWDSSQPGHPIEIPII
jgi:hypothetical protein